LLSGLRLSSETLAVLAPRLPVRMRLGQRPPAPNLPPHLFYLINQRKGEWLLATTDFLFNAIRGLRRLGGVIIAEAIKHT
jgi:hypothetical protein